MPLIRVLNNYGGKRTKERRIKPGIYDSRDERLFGQAKYLVKNGHAELVEDTYAKADVVPAPDPVEEDTLEDELDKVFGEDEEDGDDDKAPDPPKASAKAPAKSTGSKNVKG